MPENSTLLIAIAGFAVVCAGSLFILLLIILRVTGRSAWTFFSLLLRRGDEPSTEDTSTPVPAPRVNLREIAAQVDFETAVTRNVVEQDQFGANNAPPLGANAQPQDAPPMPNLERAKRLGTDNLPRRRNQGYDQDEVFGGLLDDDGDGSPDY